MKTKKERLAQRQNEHWPSDLAMGVDVATGRYMPEVTQPSKLVDGKWVAFTSKEMDDLAEEEKKYGPV